ncbi:MAG TPA: hypothetical protein VME68_06345 [Acidobacteriaceae bacterium]|nr:hypothetical protein [Acidobacteriaceae bacterium]
MARSAPSRLTLLLVFAGLGAQSVGAAGPRHPGPLVAQCSGIVLSASYLAEPMAGMGPGFQFRIDNHTARDIRLEQPVPSSAHWFALVGQRWLWRASAGTGGSLVNALSERGPMFAYQPAAPPDHPAYLVVKAHGSEQWSEPMLGNPSIAYRPSCAQCNYPGENQYRAVFAYAYLPAAQEHAPGLLHCGLRSKPVPMPPHDAVAALPAP